MRRILEVIFLKIFSAFFSVFLKIFSAFFKKFFEDF